MGIYCKSIYDKPLTLASSQKAQTPMLAGAICGSLMGFAWLVGFIIYFRKRYKRKMRKRAIAAGKREANKNKEEPAEKTIIPPDPALLMGHKAGERYVRGKGELQPPLSELTTCSPSGSTEDNIAQNVLSDKHTIS